MSNIYIKEPSTEGKVLLHTSLGDIDIELWSKEAPIACRNFVQLCMEGYYDGLVFHRVVPGFIVQGGDPTGTGEGGESAYGEPFKDEFHQRLRFVRRGLVAMANAGANDNGSQFFFTLGPCNDLNKKHTIFGKVTGDTIYNMIRLGDVDVGPGDRPLNPPMIKWAKVLANPFDDIDPRVEPERKKKKQEEKKKKSQSRATKDYKLLSFGEEAEADEEESTELSFKGSKSSHDLAKDPRLSSTPAVDMREESKDKEDSDFPQEELEKPLSDDEEGRDERKKRIRDKLTSKKNKDGDPKEEEVKSENGDDRIKQIRKESRMIARELAGRKKEDAEEDDSSSENEDDKVAASNPMFADYKAQQKIYRGKTAVSKTKGSSREQNTLELLSNFRSKMLAVREEAGWHESDEEDSVLKEDSEEDEDDNVGWLMHKFKNDTTILKDAKDMNRDVNEDRYEITDPRNTINKRRRENDKKKTKDDGRREHRRERSNHQDRNRHQRR